MTHKITVIFTVDTEPVSRWNSLEVALDHIQHVIDEGYTFEGEWEFVPESHEAFPTPEEITEADPESYPKAREGKGPVQP